MGDKPVVKSRIVRRGLAGITLLTVLLAITVLVSVGIGAEHTPFAVVAKIIGSHIFGNHLSSNGAGGSDLAVQDTIIWQMRLPRVLLAAIVGILLAVAGAALQGLLLNPLADPYTVGVSSGAAFGAAIAFLLGLSGWLAGFGVPIVAFIFALAAMLVVYSLSRFGGRVSIHSFLLAGVVVGSFLWAALTFVLTLAGQDLSVIIHWLLGSFADKPWSYIVMILPFAVIGLAVLVAIARDLNVYTLGEETARHLGVDIEKLKLIIILTTSLITAAAVSVSGIIGFAGLIVPHIARRMFGSDHRVLLPTSALSGAILMVIADTAARALGEVPVGVITAMLGAPFFLYLLRRR